MSGRLVTLTTDFGASSIYVAQLKGRLLCGIPDARLVDLTHEIAPQDILQAALVWDDCVDWYPAETIHLAVVDPGVGTERRLLYARAAGQHFVAPDNGLVARVLKRLAPVEVRELDIQACATGVPSATFHGRDVLAPAVIAIALGTPADRFSRPTDHWVELDFPAVRWVDRGVVGCVLTIDRFGNLITNLDAAELAKIPAGATLHVACAGTTVVGVTRTYADRPPGSLVALVGSSGRLELAVVNGSAAQQLAAGISAEVRVSW